MDTFHDKTVSSVPDEPLVALAVGMTFYYMLESVPCPCPCHRAFGFDNI